MGKELFYFTDSKGAGLPERFFEIILNLELIILEIILNEKNANYTRIYTKNEQKMIKFE